MKRVAAFLIVGLLMATATAGGASAGLLGNFLGGSFGGSIFSNQDDALLDIRAPQVVYLDEEITIEVWSMDTGMPENGVILQIRDQTNLTTRGMGITGSGGVAGQEGIVTGTAGPGTITVKFEKVGDYMVEAMGTGDRDAIPQDITVIVKKLFIDEPNPVYVGTASDIRIIDHMGLAVGNATVKILRAGTEIASYTTNGAGIITHTFTAIGKHTIVAEKPDYIGAVELVVVLKMKAVILTPKTVFVDEVMTGKVVNLLGQPIAGIEVTATPAPSAYNPALGNPYSTVTDAEGKFTFTFALGEHGVAKIMTSDTNVIADIDLVKVLPRKLIVNVETSVGGTILYAVTDNLGDTVLDATVYVNEGLNNIMDTTAAIDCTGIGSIDVDRAGTYYISAMKQYYLGSMKKPVAMA